VFATVPFVTLIVRSSLIPLVQLLSQLLIALGKPLNCCGEDLHLSLQGIVGFLVSWLMVAIDRVWTMQLFCLRSNDIVNHLSLQTAPTDDAQ